jgi:transcriptional regulator with XRE-family HTH domain
MKSRTFLRKSRQSRNLTVREVSEKVGINYSYYASIERGSRTPSLDIACKLEEFFGIPICILLRRDGDENT